MVKPGSCCALIRSPSKSNGKTVICPRIRHKGPSSALAAGVPGVRIGVRRPTDIRRRYVRGRMGAGQSAVSLITSRLRRSEGCGADWTAHDRATWWVLIAWPLLRVVHLVNGYISQALANREREALADIVADLARELVQPAAEAYAWADAALAAEATPSA